jgi:type II secretory pathway pseudopilin PulG
MTLVEILMVVGIIALLTGILIPAVTMVKKTAREAKQRAQFTAIELGLETYKNDFGDYPPSDPNSWAANVPIKQNSAGALKLSEALLGWDLLGFHPDSGFRVDGRNRWPYTVGTTPYAAGTYFLYDRAVAAEMDKRKGRYVEIDVANPFQLGMTTGTSGHDGLFNLQGWSPYDGASDSYVLCDVFAKGKDVLLSNGSHVKAGRPILYYRANSTGKIATDTYDFRDNGSLVSIIEGLDQTQMGAPRGRSNWNPLAASGTGACFYTTIADPRASTSSYQVACRPDSYILISAGADGFYGTSDDIRNFGR